MGLTDDTLALQATSDLFVCLYKSWCHNAVSTVALCFLTQNYRHASQLLSILYPLPLIRYFNLFAAYEINLWVCTFIFWGTFLEIENGLHQNLIIEVLTKVSHFRNI